jgi:alanine racemase
VNEVLEYDLIPTIYPTSLVEELATDAFRKGIETPIPLHIRIDLASNGLGIDPEQAVSMIKTISRIEYIQIEALYTHLVFAYGQNAEQVHIDLKMSDKVHQQLSKLNRSSQLKEKYGGLKRYIFYCDLGQPFTIESESLMIVDITDQDKQIELLQAGHIGLN